MVVLFIVCLVAGYQVAHEMLTFFVPNVPVFESWGGILVFTLGKVGFGLAIGGIAACLADRIKERLCQVRWCGLNLQRICFPLFSFGIPAAFSGGLFRPPRHTPDF